MKVPACPSWLFVWVRMGENSKGKLDQARNMLNKAAYSLVGI